MYYAFFWYSVKSNFEQIIFTKVKPFLWFMTKTWSSFRNRLIKKEDHSFSTLANFLEKNEHLLPPDAHTYVCVSLMKEYVTWMYFKFSTLKNILRKLEASFTVLLWPVYKTTDNNCRSRLFAKLTQTKNRHPFFICHW